MNSEILLIDKPTGITSFDVIRRLRKEYKEKGARAPKLGHAGTLDPLASGLMLIGVGEGTKKLSEYLKLPKEYVAEVLLGERRTTGDVEGRIVESMEVKSVREEDVKDALRQMVGTLELPVSAYSAIKKDGVPMYKRARKAEKEGREVTDVPVRKMEVKEADLLSIKNVTRNRNEKVVVSVRFAVGSGTYIRSLAEDLGRRLAPTPILPSLLGATLFQLERITRSCSLEYLARVFNQWRQRQYRCGGEGYPATLISLRRMKIGEFDVKDARSI